MYTLSEFISEIEESFSNYTESGDINRVSIKTWVIECLNKMGKNICDRTEKIIDIKNSQGYLGDDFKSLILALKLYPKNYAYVEDRPVESFIYRQRIENPAYFDYIEQVYVPNCDSKIVTERIVYDNRKMEIYHEPQFLSVVKGFKKTSFDVDCVNLHPSIRNSYNDMISITGRTIHTNFSDGKVYVQYNSLPTDEEGEIVIPEYTTGELVLWIQNYVKVKIAEDLILKNKNPQGVAQLLPMWMQNMKPLFLGAQSEVNYQGLDKNWAKKYKRKLQFDIAKFNLPG